MYALTNQRSCVCECTSVWKLEGVILWYRSLVGVDWPEGPRDAPVSASPDLALQAYATMMRVLCWFGRFKLRSPFLQASTLSIAQSPHPSYLFSIGRTVQWHYVFLEEIPPCCQLIPWYLNCSSVGLVMLEADACLSRMLIVL